MTAITDHMDSRLARWSGYDRDEQARVLAQARHHSRLVRRLRRLLPALAAVLVIATVLANGEWLLSFGPVSVGRISVENGVLKMENPRLSGYSQNDKTYEVSAAAAMQDISKPNIVRLQQVKARITEEDGRWTTVDARSGVFDTEKEELRLEEDVRVRNDKGYEMRLKSAEIAFKSGSVASNRPVEIDMLNGQLRARRLQIENRGKRIVFTGKVILTFRPKVKETADDRR
ncbi:MAG: LPS export ABC transporter periplasmic protein LptC [Hyphomicrobiales bacterium]|nr:LPS export ABC transporter periplasmic protein LptC [Hyphomicrobiales bacterium]